MNAKFYALILVSLFFLSGCGDGNSLRQSAELDQMLQNKWEEYKSTLPQSAGGIALYMITPEGYYFSSYEIEDASPDIHFRVASNTKTFTSAAIMLLNQEGKLNINDNIISNIPGTDSPYVPDTSDYAIPYKDQITIRQLLSHRAGVFDLANAAIPSSCDAPYAGDYYDTYIRSFDDNHTFTFDELLSVVSHCNLSLFAPGTDYHYSNTGYSLLGKIIERVSGMPYSEFIKERLMLPNGLFESSVPYLGTDRSIPAPFAAGNYIGDGVVVPWTEDNMSLNVAEGNVISTPADLGRWVRALISGDAGLSVETISQMTECASTISESSCYGLGIYEILSPIKGYGHTGAHAGYMSLMMHDPDTQVTTVLFISLLNYDDVMGEGEFMNGVREAAYGILGY